MKNPSTVSDPKAAEEPVVCHEMESPKDDTFLQEASKPAHRCPQCGHSLTQTDHAPTAAADAAPAPELAPLAAVPGATEIDVEQTECTCGQNCTHESCSCAPADPDEQPKPAWKLMRVAGSAMPEDIPLDQAEMILGQNCDCDITLHGDGFVSRCHARICCENETVTIEDLGSSNGTFIKLRRPVVLTDGDVVLLGTSTFKLGKNNP